ncbi:SusD/RagB family nutrient-binding outer membrane lipoprotein [Sphingobacterium sp. E70]|uniref:SusD/RagB family nutrient-binding outer membrane lipoprotein n=1 Tax=Sphingobacterium sp. E70 TaxID=2853439 RepID=UPI00211B9CB0|nr:SusD/RagB family nutrient-binding outer membrane lipoprotein [Sphingobacterium sp. E70]ULT25554.1 SusD/RagB family nutrient-binding outer membrane lipoprotein [Sphingobacterium sp. E70]
MKQKINKLFVLVLTLGTTFTSCNNFEDINTDPNGSTRASRPLLATNIILDLTSSSMGKPFYANQLVSKSLAWGESADGNQYNSFGRSDLSGYSTVINGNKMLELTTDANRPAYEGLYYFAKAYQMFYLTMTLGDIPYTEAFQGESGILKPKYDTQKEALLAILNDLDRSYEAFGKGVKLEADPIFKSDPVKWRKTVRAFQLKVLMHLSIKQTDNDLKVASRFQNYAKSDLMTSNADNFQRIYSNNAKEYYPVYFTRLNHNPYAMLSYLIIDKLKESSDNRLYYFAKPAKSETDKQVPANSPDAYLSVDPSASFDVISKRWSSGQFSGINARYTQLPSGEPIVKLGYAEQQFILAEAALRGWIPGQASSYYNEAIRASMLFVADNTPDVADYHHNKKIDGANIQAVQNHPSNLLTGNFETDLEKIMYQKYLLSFMQREWESYYDYRRTGYPKFPINPNTNQNITNTKMPMRWMYPSSEFDTNRENVDAAIQRQWGGVDNVDKIIWLLQK